METAKVILITGASRGIGRQLALDCARNGYSVAVNYVANTAAAQEVMDQIGASGGDALLVRADVSVGAEVAAMVAAVMQRFGCIDCVINNAGVGRIIDLQSIDEAHFEQTLRTNLISAFLVSQAAIPHMVAQGGGRLIFMSSLAARTGGLVSAAYAASKAGAEGLMHYYATYLLRHRITANAIAPALIASDIVEEMELPVSDKLPLGRLGRPERAVAGGPDDHRNRVHHRADDSAQRGPLHDMTRVITSVEDLRLLAKRRVPRMFYDYADSGSWTEGTYRANSADFQAIKLCQRVAVDITDRTALVHLNV